MGNPPVHNGGVATFGLETCNQCGSAKNCCSSHLLGAASNQSQSPQTRQLKKANSGAKKHFSKAEIPAGTGSTEAEILVRNGSNEATSVNQANTDACL